MFIYYENFFWLKFRSKYFIASNKVLLQLIGHVNWIQFEFLHCFLRNCRDTSTFSILFFGQELRIMTSERSSNIRTSITLLCIYWMVSTGIRCFKCGLACCCACIETRMELTLPLLCHHSLLEKLLLILYIQRMLLFCYSLSFLMANVCRL